MWCGWYRATCVCIVAFRRQIDLIPINDITLKLHLSMEINLQNSSTSLQEFFWNFTAASCFLTRESRESGYVITIFRGLELELPVGRSSIEDKARSLGPANVEGVLFLQASPSSLLYGVSLLLSALDVNGKVSDHHIPFHTHPWPRWPSQMSYIIVPMSQNEMLACVCTLCSTSHVEEESFGAQ